MLPFWELLDTQEEKDKILLLYECFERRLYVIAFSMLKDEGKAEDVVQDTFIKMTEHLDKIEDNAYRILEQHFANGENKEYKAKELRKMDDGSCARAWNYIVTILKNKIYDMFRKEKKENVIFFNDYLEQTISYEDDRLKRLENEELGRELKQVWRNLKYPYKEVLLLKYVNGCSTAEIAGTLGLKADNVRQILKRGRDLLKRQIKERDCYGSGS